MDGVDWDEYGERLDERLLDLENRIHRGSYHPQPVRRVHIPKGDGRTRPLGIPALEDKIVQQAVRMVLEPIYEAEFVGILVRVPTRNGRQHDALDALAVAIDRKVNWVLDADIRGVLRHHRSSAWMQEFIEHRIGDTRLVRLLMKWVKAGVMEDGKLTRDRMRDAAGWDHQPAPGEHLPALRARPVGRCRGGRSTRAARCTSCVTPTTS